jgi:hypothetical protein
VKNIKKPPAWLPEFTELVQQHLDRWDEREHEHQPRYDAELAELNSKMLGFSQSLAKSDLAPVLRNQIEADYTAALERKTEIDAIMAESEARQRQATQLISEEEVLDRLNRLASVLADNNPTLGNLELSLHIDRIDCFDDGKVVMRTCKLAGLNDMVDLLADASSAIPMQAPLIGEKGVNVAKRRRRGRRRYYNHERGGADDRAVADFAADPNRFAGLPDQFFWIDEFSVPVRQFWSEAHAQEVWDYWKSAPKRSKAAVARHFKKSIPTIRLALRHAEEQMARNGK